MSEVICPCIVLATFVSFYTISTAFFISHCFPSQSQDNPNLYNESLPKANRKYANEKEDSDDSNAKESSSNKSGKGSGGKSKAAKKETDNKKNAPPTANSRKDSKKDSNHV